MAEMPLRFHIARFLVIVAFVWPFINGAYFYPDSTVEINFFLVFLAIGLAPAALLDDKLSLLLVIPMAGIAAAMGSTEAGLRIVIGVVPLLFLMGFYRFLASQGWELVPRPVAYRALQAFVGFSAVQYIDQHVVSIIPEWLTNALTLLVPRYTAMPYDELGIRGVQGWASEPSAAAMTCFAFAVVAVLQQPEKRWRILFWFAAMADLNKSIYAIVLVAALGLALLPEAKNKMIALFALIPLTVGLTYFVLRSGRMVELRDSVLIYGLSDASNRQFLRLGQIIYPLAAFPRVYSPVELFGIKMEPLGLLPLLIGYGSLIGLVVYYRTVLAKLRSGGAKSLTLALTSAAALSFLISPDFAPSIVAFAYTIRPTPSEAPEPRTSRTGWLGRIVNLVLSSAADRRRGRTAQVGYGR